MKIVDAEGAELPRDGKAFGDLLVKGPWILRQYFRSEGGDPLRADGWFPTGDVATIDPDGYLQITDRSKDVIKSGGEWISSIDLENIAMGHPGVMEAAVIGVHHPKWDERPLLVVVKKPGAALTREDAARLLRGQGGEVVAAGRRGVRRAAPAHCHRQALEAHPAPAVQGLRAAHRRG